MVHDLSLTAFRLDPIEEFIGGDSRVLAFQVTDEDGTGIDISAADLSWRLVERAYQERTDAALTDGDAGVSATSAPADVDPTVGEFEVQLEPAATVDLWGSYTQVPTVVQSDGSTASWVGEMVITA